MSKPQYRVLTWDIDAQEFTPQDGVPSLVTGAAGLRSALRDLRNLGYAANRNDEDSDASVLVELVTDVSEVQRELFQ